MSPPLSATRCEQAPLAPRGTTGPVNAASPRAALGLPAGSVRAILTLLIVAVVIVEAARGREVGIVWSETLMIVLAHYFSSRRFLDLPRAVIRRLEEEGHLEKEAAPLYLPRHTIRGMIILAFVGLGVYLYREGRLPGSPAVSILGTVAAYFTGVLCKAALDWWRSRRGCGPSALWADVKAWLVLGFVAVTATFYFVDRPQLLPAQVQNATIGLVLFYFGSR